MIRTTQLKNNELKERLKKLSKPINEVVSMVQPSKYHDRMKPISSTLKSMEMDDESEEEFDLDEFIDELEEDIMLDEILEEMGYYDDEEDLEEMKLDFNSKGYKEARKLIQKLRGKLFRELDDDDLETFVNTLGDAFGMVRR